MSARPQCQPQTPEKIQRDKDLRCVRCNARFAPGALNTQNHCKLCGLEVRVTELEMQVVRMGERK